MTKTIAEFWQHDGSATIKTVVDEHIRVLQFRNAKGLLTTEKWLFGPTLWVRVSVR